jgi:hypothetical protein
LLEDVARHHSQCVAHAEEQVWEVARAALALLCEAAQIAKQHRHVCFPRREHFVGLAIRERLEDDWRKKLAQCGLPTGQQMRLAQGGHRGRSQLRELHVVAQ